MSLNLKIDNTNNKNPICINHGGLNISPSLSWTSIKNTKSYILIFEDPDAPSGTFIHWYIPYISPQINTINQLNNNHNNLNLNYKSNNINLNNLIKSNDIKLIQGFNSLGKLGYHGPCAPDKTGTHRYIFTLYALSDILPNLEENLKIKNSFELENLFNTHNIHILAEESKTYLYKYNDSKLTPKNNQK